MIQKFLIGPNNTIEEALRLIQKNSRRCLVVVDKKNKLLGTLSDGDIRGALLENKKLKDKISPFFNKKAKFVLSNNLNKEKITSLLKKFDIIPITTQDRIVEDIIFPGKEKNKIDKLKTSVVIMAGGKGTSLPRPPTRQLRRRWPRHQSRCRFRHLRGGINHAPCTVKVQRKVHFEVNTNGTAKIV